MSEEETPPRLHVIHRLVDAAMIGMAAVAQGTTASEVFSAQFTMAHQAVRVALASGTKKSDIRSILNMMLLECAEDTVQ